MGLSQLVTRWMGKDPVSDLAERVAGRSRQQTWQRIQHRINSLGAAEARGYIRSRATAIIDDQVDRLIAEEGVKAAGNRDRITALATEMLIQSILATTHASRQSRRIQRAA